MLLSDGKIRHLIESKQTFFKIFKACKQKIKVMLLSDESIQALIQTEIDLGQLMNLCGSCGDFREAIKIIAEEIAKKTAEKMLKRKKKRKQGKTMTPQDVWLKNQILKDTLAVFRTGCDEKNYKILKLLPTRTATG